MVGGRYVSRLVSQTFIYNDVISVENYPNGNLAGVANFPGFPLTLLASALKVSHPQKPLVPRQI